MPEKFHVDDYSVTDGYFGKPYIINAATSYMYNRPGVYFTTARVTSHRQGDVNAKHCRIPNLASARIVVS